MRIKRERVRQKTFKHIEQEIMLLDETIEEIKQLREYLMTNHESYEKVGGRSNLPGDPVGNMASRLSDNPTLTNMEQMVRIINEVYELSCEQDKQFFKLFYWTKPQTLTLQGIAQKMYISDRQILRIRYRIANQIANRLGWW